MQQTSQTASGVLEITNQKTMHDIYVPEPIRRELLRLLVHSRAAFANGCLELAHKGSPDAAALLALMYFNESIKELDPIGQARYWAERAAESKNEFGAYVLALIELVEGHHSKARGMLVAGASNGFGPAAWLAGQLYQTGIGGKRDRVKAAALFDLAIQRGHILASIDYYHLVQSGEFGLVEKWRGKFKLPFLYLVFWIRKIFTPYYHSNKLAPDKVFAYLLEVYETPG